MAKSGTAETIIAHGVRLEGDFTSEGDVTIEGDVSGTVRTAANLIVGDKSKIRADVMAKNATVSGEIRGNLHVEDRLDIKETARIIGDVSAKIITVGAGAQINGTVTMGEGAKADTGVAEDSDA